MHACKHEITSAFIHSLDFSWSWEITMYACWGEFLMLLRFMVYVFVNIIPLELSLCRNVFFESWRFDCPETLLCLTSSIFFFFFLKFHHMSSRRRAWYIFFLWNENAMYLYFGLHVCPTGLPQRTGLIL